MERINEQATSELPKESLDFLWNTLSLSFKKTELRPMESQYKAFQHRNYYVSYFEEALHSAFVLWWNFENLIFCEYIVVSIENRRKGMGSQLLKHLGKIGKRIVLEVEKGSEIGLFYSNNGFVVNHYSYNAISLNGENAEKYDIFSYSQPLTKEEYSYFWNIINEPEYQF